MQSARRIVNKNSPIPGINRLLHEASWSIPDMVISRGIPSYNPPVCRCSDGGLSEPASGFNPKRVRRVIEKAPDMSVWGFFYGELDRGELAPNQTRTGSYVEDSKRGEAVDACYGLSVSD